MNKKGRPLKYGEPMKMVSMRVPVSKVIEVKNIIKNFIKLNK